MRELKKIGALQIFASLFAIRMPSSFVVASELIASCTWRPRWWLWFMGWSRRDGIPSGVIHSMQAGLAGPTQHGLRRVESSAASRRTGKGVEKDEEGDGITARAMTA